MDTCEKCGKTLEIGEWPWCGHGFPSKGTTAPFVPYFDIGLGRQINSQADRWREMKKQGCQYSSKGEF